MAFTKVVGAGIHTLSNITSHNINSSGIITATKFVGPMENGSGISTFYDLRVTNNLTVDGTTTTLDTKLVEVDKIEVEADSTNVAIAVTQTGSGDLIRLYDGASQVVTVDDEGKVGIGTDNPFYTTSLDVLDSSSGTDEDLFSVRSKTGAFLVQCSDKDAANPEWRLRTFASEDLVFSPGGTGAAGEKVRITSSGRVGIGTDTPLAGLHISDSTAYGSPQISSRKAQLIISAGTETSADIQLLAGSYNHIFFGTSSDANAGSIVYTHTGGYTNNMTFGLGTGNVNLTHRGTFQIKSSLAAGNSFMQDFTIKDSNNNAQWQLGMYTNANEYLYLNNNAEGNIIFAHAANEHVSFASNGKVGIGTALSQPSFKLDVREAHGVAYSASGTSAQLAIGNINSSANTNSSGIHMYSDGNGRGVVNLNCLNNSTNASADFTIQTRHAGTLGERLRIASDGEILIPAAGANRLSMRHTSGGKFVIKNPTAANLSFGTNNNDEEVVIQNGGNVGIGTVNPDHSLHVYKESGDSVITIESTGNGNKSALEFYRTSSGGNSMGAGSIYVTGITSASEAIMHFGVGHNISHGQVPRLSIKGDGEVGIGTDNPDTMLHIRSQFPTLLIEGNNDTVGYTVSKVDVRANFYRKAGYVISGDNGTEDIFMGRPYGQGDTTVPLVFNFQGSEKVRITSDGEVGINTTSPSAPLNVHKINGTIAVFGDDRSGDNSTFECIKIKNNVTAYPAITNDSSNDTLDLRSMGSVQVTIDSNNNSTGKYFRVVTNGEGDSGTELFKVKDDGKVVLGNSTGAQPSATVGGAQFWGGSYPGDFRISSGAGASGTEAGAMSIMGSNHNASLAHGSNYGAQLSLFNYNTTDGNSTAVSYHNSNGLAIARVIGNNVSHSSRTGQLVFMTSNGSHPEEKMRLTKDGQLDVTANNNGNPIGITIKNTNTASHSHARLRLEAQNAASYSNIYTDHANSALRLEYNSSNSMYIKSNGNVGLGTDTPGQKLSIQSGDLSIKQGTLYLSSDRDAAVPGSSYGYQVISGYKVFPDSDTYVNLAYVGHSHSIQIQYMCVENGNTALGGSHGEIFFHTTYGNSQQGIGQQAYTLAMNGGRITSGVSFQYQNGGAGSHGGNYVLKAKVSYSGTDDNFALHYTIKGVSAGNMYT